jgi:hypothetical protein
MERVVAMPSISNADRAAGIAENINSISFVK